MLLQGEKKWIIGGAVLLWLGMMLNSVNSINYYNPDEHYQVIEFAGYKQGKVQEQDLAWEYEAQSRQALQPFIAYLVFESSDAVGITDPAWQIRILHALSGIFAIFCMTCFVVTHLKYFGVPWRKIFILCSYLAWFVPFYYIRFTSEAFSQSLLLWALALLSLKKDRWIFFAGIILGLMFYVRFQSLLGYTGLAAGLIFFEKYRLKKWGLLFLGGAVSLLLGICTDRWFYNDWVFTPYTYFYYQVFKNVANDFGTLPFHFYLGQLFVFSTPVLGFLIYMSILVPPFTRKITTPWLIFVSTLVFLSCTGHKEFRFLVSILNLLPFMLIYTMQSLYEKRLAGSGIFLKKGFFVLLFLINALCFTRAVFYNNNICTPNPQGLSYRLSTHYHDQNIYLLYFKDAHPYKDDVILNFKHDTLHLYQKFVMPPVFYDEKIDSLNHHTLAKRKENTTQLLYIKKSRLLEMSTPEKVLEQGYILKYRSVPAFFDRFLNEHPAWGKQYNDWVFYIFELN